MTFDIVTPNMIIKDTTEINFKRIAQYGTDTERLFINNERVYYHSGHFVNRSGDRIL